jgi:hypothetical protein
MSTPTSRKVLLRMLRRCQSFGAISWYMAVCTVRMPARLQLLVHEQFSPIARHLYPAAVIRAPEERSPGSWCARTSYFAISRLWECAAAVSRMFHRSATSPWARRSALINANTRWAS